MKRLCTLLLAAAIWAGCSDSPTDAAPPAITSTATDSSGPIFRYVVVNLARPAGVEITYQPEGGGPKLQVTADSSALRHRLFLPRLRERARYTFEVRSRAETGATGQPMTGAVTTGALPPELAALRMTGSGSPSQPLTMVELMITTTGYNGALVADADGNIVWYYRTRTAVNGVSRRKNGNFILLDNDSGLVELSPDAQVVRRLRNGATQPYGLIHHDATVTANDRVLFLARETKTIRDTAVVGEAIWEWLPETNTVSKKWSSFDFFDWATHRGPQTAANNWLHANSIEVSPRGNIIVSARNLDQVFSIAPDFRAIEWTMGGPNATIMPALADRFYSQHSAIEVAPNRVLLFDNGLGRPNNESWSRAIEYQVNPTARTATVAWQYRPAPDISALRVGSVVRLANGNTVIGFGWGQGVNGDDPITAREVTPAGAVIYSLVAKRPEFDRVYRLKPLSDIGGERVVQ